MKHKSVSAIAAIGVLHLVFLFSILCFVLPVNLYSQSTDKQKTGESAGILDVLLQKLEGKHSSAPLFDIRGTVMDAEGKELDDVKIIIDLSRPDYRNITHSEYEQERITANREFHVEKKDGPALQCVFRRTGITRKNVRSTSILQKTIPPAVQFGKQFRLQ